MLPTIWRTNKSALRSQQFPLLSLFDEVNRLFDESFRDVSTTRSTSTFMPSLDLKEAQNEYVITGEFPGLEAKDIHIELRENSLTISGEKRSEHEQKEGERVYRERSFGSFSRTIPFDVEVDEDSANAEMKNGVLTIKVPKSSKVIKGAKKLTIKGA